MENRVVFASGGAVVGSQGVCEDFLTAIQPLTQGPGKKIALLFTPGRMKILRVGIKRVVGSGWEISSLILAP